MDDSAPEGAPPAARRTGAAAPPAPAARRTTALPRCVRPGRARSSRRSSRRSRPCRPARPTSSRPGARAGADPMLAAFAAAEAAAPLARAAPSALASTRLGASERSRRHAATRRCGAARRRLGRGERRRSRRAGRGLRRTPQPRLRRSGAAPARRRRRLGPGMPPARRRAAPCWCIVRPSRIVRRRLRRAPDIALRAPEHVPVALPEAAVRADLPDRGRAALRAASQRPSGIASALSRWRRPSAHGRPEPSGRTSSALFASAVGPGRLEAR